MPKTREEMKQALGFQRNYDDQIYWTYLLFSDNYLNESADFIDEEKRAIYGFNEDAYLEQDEKAFSKDMLRALARVPEGVSPLAHYRATMRTCGKLTAQTMALSGQEGQMVYDLLDGEDRQADKAVYLYRQSGSQYRYDIVANMVSDLETEMEDDVKEFVSNTIENDKRITYDKFFDKAGLTKAQKQRLYQTYPNMEPKKAIYEDFASKEVFKNLPEESREETVREYMSDELKGVLFRSWQQEGEEEVKQSFSEQERSFYEWGKKFTKQEQQLETAFDPELEDWAAEEGRELADDLLHVNHVLQFKSTRSHLLDHKALDSGKKGSLTDINAPENLRKKDYYREIVKNREKPEMVAEWINGGTREKLAETQKNRQRRTVGDSLQKGGNRLLKEMSAGGALSDSAARTYADIYLYDAFLSSCDHKKYPELFDPSHPDHELLQARLSDEIGAYADECLKGLIPEGGKSVDGQNLADFLQYADHERYMDKIMGNTYSRLHDSRVRELIEAPGMAAQAAKLKAAPARFGSGSVIYDEIQQGLADLGRMHESEKENLREAYESGAEVKLNPVNTAERVETMRTTLEKMDRYLGDKTRLKAQKGDLGTNGERRYRVMQEARKALQKEYDVISSVSKNGLTGKDIRNLSDPLKPDIASLKAEAEKKVRHLDGAEAEKLRREEALRSADKLSEAVDKKQMEKINSLHCPVRPILGQYKLEIRNAITPMLFARSARNMAFQKAEGVNGTESIERYNDRLTKIMKAKDGRSNAVRDYAQQLVNPVSEFYDELVTMVEDEKEAKGKINADKVMELTDEALKRAYQKVKEPENIRKLDLLSTGIGSRVNSQTFRRPEAGQEVPRKQEPVKGGEV
ncbi:MAG: hypothetical protein K6A39_04550, partial [Clostridiales bacterium]|nr:hypothetical protein [Clostridiales bacterium]